MVHENELRRAAERVVRHLIAQDLVEGENLKPDALIAKVLAAFQKNMQEEASIEREAERLMKTLERQSIGMDQRKLQQKIREKVAKDRNFIL